MTRRTFRNYFSNYLCFVLERIWSPNLFKRLQNYKNQFTFIEILRLVFSSSVDYFNFLSLWMNHLLLHLSSGFLFEINYFEIVVINKNCAQQHCSQLLFGKKILVYLHTLPSNHGDSKEKFQSQDIGSTKFQKQNKKQRWKRRTQNKRKGGD